MCTAVHCVHTVLYSLIDKTLHVGSTSSYLGTESTESTEYLNLDLLVHVLNLVWSMLQLYETAV